MSEIKFNIINFYNIHNIPLSIIIEAIITRNSYYEEDKIYGALGLLIPNFMFYMKIEYNIGFNKVFERLILSLNKIPHDLLCLDNFNINKFDMKKYNIIWENKNNIIYCKKCNSNIYTMYYNPFSSYILTRYKKINIKNIFGSKNSVIFKNKEYINIDDFSIYFDNDVIFYDNVFEINILIPCKSKFYEKNNNYIGYIYNCEEYIKCFVKINHDKLSKLKTNNFFIRNNKIIIRKYNIEDSIIDKKNFIEKCIK